MGPDLNTNLWLCEAISNLVHGGSSRTKSQITITYFHKFRRYRLRILCNYVIVISVFVFWVCSTMSLNY